MGAETWKLENSTARADRAEAGTAAGPDAPARPPAEAFDAVAVGARLRAARVAMGRDRGDVTRDIRIRDAHLRAIEEGRLEDLPGPAYRAGFLRAYANYLGLDGAGLAERLRADRGTAADRPPLRAIAPVDKGFSLVRPMVSLAILLAVSAYSALYVLGDAGGDAVERSETAIHEGPDLVGAAVPAAIPDSHTDAVPRAVTATSVSHAKSRNAGRRCRSGATVGIAVGGRWAPGGGGE